jgi:hypothetical protein
MTLRVEISIIPFGDEGGKKVLHTVNISNLGDHYNNQGYREIGVCKYGVELDKYKTGEYDQTLHHQRNDGALMLVNRALERIVYG